MGKKRKSYFNNNNNDKASSKKFKFNKSMKLGPNMKGFLITYNCKFTFCLNEAKKLLEQFSISDKTVVDKQKSNEKSEDLEKLLKAELDTLHERDKEFNVIDTGAKHTILISLESIDPNQVVESIFDVCITGYLGGGGGLCWRRKEYNFFFLTKAHRDDSQTNGTICAAPNSDLEHVQVLLGRS
jgi:hypothetical protein